MVKEKQWENHRTKVISCIVFGVYLLLLTWLVLFKFAFAIEEIPHLRQLNLIPFHYETSVKPIMHIKEVVYNILVFVPAGVYFTAFFGERKWWKGIGASFLISLSFEIIQWIFSVILQIYLEIHLVVYWGHYFLYFLGKYYPRKECV